MLEQQAVGIFGFSPEDHIGKCSFPPVQAVPSFPSSFPHLFAGKDQLRCLIPCAIDQVQTYLYMTIVTNKLAWYRLACILTICLAAQNSELVPVLDSF